MMRKGLAILILLFALSSLTSFSFAGFTIPSDVYRMDQLDQAKNEAVSSNRQILFLYSDENSTCPLASKASVIVINQFRKNFIVIYFDKKDWDKAPIIVRKAINSPTAGEYIPIGIITNPNMTEVIAFVPYKRPN